MSEKPKRRWFQFSLKTLLASLTLLAFVAAGIWQFWPWWQERVLVQNLRERMLHAQDSREAGEALVELLKPNGFGRLQRLSMDTDIGIALKASFELLADRRGRVKLSPENQALFLKTLAQKTQLQPPAWWSKELLEEYPPDARPQLHYAGKVEYKTEVGLFVDERKLLMPTSEFALAKMASSIGGQKHLALIDTPCSYIACCDGYGYRFDLLCVDSATGKVIWRSPVWAGGLDNIGGQSGLWLPHDAQLEKTDNLIVVWGAGTTATYVEAFDCKNGKNQFRFSTDTWCVQ